MPFGCGVEGGARSASFSWLDFMLLWLWLRLLNAVTVAGALKRLAAKRAHARHGERATSDVGAHDGASSEKNSKHNPSTHLDKPQATNIRRLSRLRSLQWTNVDAVPLRSRLGSSPPWRR